ncbi:LysE family translocator [Achromobacter sp. NCFB-sbj8-Ac1-l]|uniref:LysE family translocator n=1 Tax=unclassified Achromobacter TaxID=2626865 RepID=UPI004046F3AE
MDAAHSYLPGMLLAYSAFVLATVSPGPAVLATLGTAMSAGRRAGVMLGLGVAMGSCSLGVLTALGLSVVLASYAGALVAIKIAGGLYLLWLAVKSLRSAARRHVLPAMTDGARPGALAYFARGWAVQISNPKAILAWIAIISLGLKPGAPHWVAPAIVVACTLTGMAFYSLCAVVFSSPAMARGYARARRVIDGVLGVFFAAAAVRLLTSKT